MADNGNVLPLRIPIAGRPGEYHDMSRVTMGETQLVNIYLIRGMSLDEAKAAAEEFIRQYDESQGEA